MIRSLWTLTFDPSGSPLTVLTTADALEEEPKFTISKGLEVVELENSSAPFLRPRGNVAWQVSFSRLITAGTDAQARAALLDWQITLAALGKAALKCQFAGEDDYWTFGNSFITTGQTWRKVEARLPTYVLAVSITATNLTKTTV